MELVSVGTIRPPSSFEAVFAAEFQPLHRYIRRRVGRDAADDVAAETFARAFVNWESFDQRRPVRPWLYGIATNLLRRLRRDEERKLRAYARTGQDPIADHDQDVLINRLSDAQTYRELASALAELRPVDRDLLLLRAWAELTDEEISVALSLPLGTVKSRLYRTRKRLESVLGYSPKG